MATMTKKQPATVSKSTAVTDASLNGNQKQWKVSIYMAADNNLKEECVWALTEILRVDPIPEVNVVAQFDSGDSINRYDFKKVRGNANSSGASTIPGQSSLAGSPPRKASIKLDSLAEAIQPKVISRQNNGHQGKEVFISPKNVSDPIMIKEFLHAEIGKPTAVTTVVSQSSHRIPASKSEVKPYNMLVLSGHGSGAVGDFFNTDDPPSALSIPELRSILESIVEKPEDKIDVLGMDSCLMSMAEVCYELRNTVKFMVGAEGFEQNTGWPYHNILAALQAEPTMGPKEFACAIVKEYIHYYSDYTVAGISVDHAACDLGQSSRLRQAVKKLAKTLRDKLSDLKDAILLAHWRAQSYKSEQYVDLWDFCDLLENNCKDADMTRACKETKDAVEKFALISCYSGAAFQHSHGLSVYFPWDKSDLDNDLPKYRELAFHKDTKWGNFLELYGIETERKPRVDSDKPNNKSGAGKLLHMPLRDGMEANVRTNPAISERGEYRRTARVKNPPHDFNKYDDDCAGKCGK